MQFPAQKIPLAGFSENHSLPETANTVNVMGKKCGLTESRCNSLKIERKKYRVYDNYSPAGMYMVVSPTGGKAFAMDYTFEGNRKSPVLGKFGAITAEEARRLCHEWRKKILVGIDPMAERKAQKQGRLEERARTFGVAAERWFATNSEFWASATTKQTRSYLDNDLIPALGKKPLSDIETVDLADLLKKLHRRAPNAAVKARQWIKAIYKYARADGLTKNTPEADIGALLLRHESQKYPHLDYDSLPELLCKLDAVNASPLVKTATWLSLWTANRPGIVRTLKWSELDLDQSLWTIPRGREGMKRGYSHITPLPRQAVDALKALQGLTGRGEYVFPNRNSPRRPMSDRAVNRLLKELGYGGRQTAHGFRHLVSTALNERGYEPDWVERQLAHGDPDTIRGIYNEAVYLEPRMKMMQDWADLLDKMRRGERADVIPLKPTSLRA